MFGAAMLEAERMKAKERQATSTGGSNPQLLENLPEAGAGDARDKAGKLVGVSGKSADGEAGGRGKKKNLRANLPEGLASKSRDKAGKLVGVSGKSADGEAGGRASGTT